MDDDPSDTNAPHGAKIFISVLALVLEYSYWLNTDYFVLECSSWQNILYWNIPPV
jgi:hypothetical protein